MGMILKVENSYESDLTKLYLMQGERSDRWSLKYIGDGQIEVTFRDPNVPKAVEPFMTMQRDLFDDFLKCLVDYADQNGIKPENQTLIEGKFQAQSEHLADLREILLGDSKVKIERTAESQS